MKQIQTGNRELIALLGEQVRKDKNVHISMYVFDCKLDDGWLFFHTLTRKLLFLTQREYESIESNDKVSSFLFKNWFWVNETLDEKQLYEELSSIFLPAQERNFKGYNIYVIFTTTTCNANCFYCFERNTKPITMTKETALQVVHYIDQSRNKDEIVSLHWFGGEPMCNYSVIDTICHEMEKREIPFTSRFTSNASIFNEELIDRAVKVWKTENVQVTLDGTEKIHNDRKAYRDNKYNFQQTLKNIDQLEAFGIKVTIRLNCDESNIEDMEILVDQLVARYEDRTRIFIDPHPLFNCDENEKIIDSTEEFYHRMIELEEKTHSYNLNKNEQAIEQSNNALNRIRTGTCQSVSMRIAPDGKLYPCQHIDQVSSYGDIWNGITDLKDYEEWKSEEHAFKCKECTFRPLCASMKNCNAIRSNCKNYAKLKYQDWIKSIYSDSIDDNRILICEKQYSVNRLLGDYVVIIDSENKVMRLNATAFYMFEKIAKGTTLRNLREDLKTKFNLNEEISRQVTNGLVNKLISCGCIK